MDNPVVDKSYILLDTYNTLGIKTYRSIYAVTGLIFAGANAYDMNGRLYLDISDKRYVTYYCGRTQTNVNIYGIILYV